MRSIAMAISLAFVSGCTELPNPIDAQEIQIVVRDRQSRPVEGALVQVGFDWTHFQARTNSDGIVTLPGDVGGLRASIAKTNYLPNVVPRLYTGIYPLYESPRRLSQIGSIAGTVTRFGPGELLTVDYGGTYHVYGYTGQSLTEVMARPLGDSAVSIRAMRLIGDTLWCATNSRGIHVFSLRDPRAPRRLFQLRITGNLWPFAVTDSLLIVGDGIHKGPVRVFSYHTDGVCAEIARVADHYVRRIGILGNAVILLGNSETLPVVLDVADPRHPRIAFSGHDPGFDKGFFSAPHIILTPRTGLGDAARPARHRVLMVSEQAEVSVAGEFAADAWITAFVPGGIAYGRNYFDANTTCLLQGSMATGFTTVATIAGYSSDDIGGSFPPFFVIDGRLWELKDP